MSLRRAIFASNILKCPSCAFNANSRSIETSSVIRSTLPQARTFSKSFHNFKPPHHHDQSDDFQRLQELSSGEITSANFPAKQTRPFPSSTSTPLTTDPPNPNSNDSLPWYLRVQHPRPPVPKHLLERQKVPPLPSNPPALLPPLLEHLSTTLGLDYLTLHDLRSLDPPSALGANLIMLMGTARSEKHLHTAADRCCRWLRSEHKLQPVADGLLGRNEIRLKLKRRNRRAKMLARAGMGDRAAELDDGISTGWVCVRVAGVEGMGARGGEEGIRDLEDMQGVVGFGKDIGSLGTVVVQMLTEEKRAEIDLEGLWKAVLEKNERRLRRIRGEKVTHGVKQEEHESIVEQAF